MIAVRAAVAEGLLDERRPLAMLFDLGHFDRRLEELRAGFPGVLHTLAVKANPLSNLLRRARKRGFGLEAASLAELQMGLALDFRPEVLFFDSPAKTRPELELALAAGVSLNLDNLQEVERVAALVGTAPPRSAVGLRVNPQIGEGTIRETSTATSWSKFGVGLQDHRPEILAAFEEHPWLDGLHVHVGSQGCRLDQLVTGVKILHELADEIESGLGPGRIRRMDIGGGLPVTYVTEDREPTIREYADLLRREVPALFDGSRRVITELGRWVHAHAGSTVSRVEYTKVAGGHRIAVIHAGADLFPRPVYRPDLWTHRLTVLDPGGNPKVGDLVPQDVVGPLCFSGDIVASQRPLPPIDPGDLVVVHDTGAYTLGMWSRYNSRLSPPVLAYDSAAPGSLELLRAGESIEDVLKFWD